MQQGRTYVGAEHARHADRGVRAATPTGSSPAATARPRSRASVGDALVGAFDAEQVAVQLIGDSIYTNPLMLGYAWQQGRVPLSATRR